MPFPHIPSPPTLFPTYLVPSLPFRRKSSTDSNASSTYSSSAPSDTSSSSPPPGLSYLSGHTSHLRCARCAADLALASQIISKGFTGRHGRAYLVAPSTSSISPNPLELRTAKAKNDALPNLPNTYTHKPVPRQLVTGAHTVGDISCAQCGSVLGWKYIHAEQEGQRYKVGKFILETKRVCKTSSWEGEDDGEAVREVGGMRRESVDGRRRRSSGMPPTELPKMARLEEEEEELEFDCEDEDERNALFNGIWPPQLARQLRAEKGR